MGKEKIDEGLVKRRRISGIVLMIVGFPNFLMAMITALGGFALAGILIYIVIEMRDSGGDGPFQELCIVFIAILIIMIIIALIIGSFIAFFFALGVGGQTIGGYYGYKGVHFWRAAVLAWIGTIFSFLGGIALVLIGISADGASTEVRAALIGLGAYELISSLVAGIAAVLMISAKSTFRTAEKKGKEKKSKKKDQKKGNKKKREQK